MKFSLTFRGVFIWGVCGEYWQRIEEKGPNMQVSFCDFTLIFIQHIVYSNTQINNYIIRKIVSKGLHRYNLGLIYPIIYVINIIQCVTQLTVGKACVPLLYMI